ncbi:MAG TPA: prephenate dehydrogenase/arogenate dehydrogenase family protein [Patescibacteria group bacterium]|nr:prephenate dehydrogenase/arogenate dehydrogenase family protein [Patescibacteria group bacterium]
MSSGVKKITIIGFGLIGGSLGMAFKAAQGAAVLITAVDHDPKTVAASLKLGAADQGTDDPTAGVQDADLIFLCTPVLQIPALVKTIAPHLKKGAIVSDVCSTKGYVMECMEKDLPDHCSYIAGHPMAGRELSGVGAAHKDLFKGRWYILIPHAKASPQALEQVGEVVGWTEAQITVMDVDRHDWCTAVISHLPHVAAAAMVNLLAQSPDETGADCGPLYHKLAGGGFRDTTRIASSNPDMWADVCLTNDTAIIKNLERFQGILNQVIAQIREGDRQGLYDYFAAAQQSRNRLLDI